MIRKLTLLTAALLIANSPIAGAAECEHNFNHARAKHPFPLHEKLAEHAQEITNLLGDPCLDKIVKRGGLNPSVKDMSKQICASNHPCVLKAAIDEAWKEELAPLRIPIEVAYAFAWKESTWQHWDRTVVSGTTAHPSSNVYPSYDGSSHGLFQINQSVWQPTMSNDEWQRVIHDPLSNAREGLKIFKSIFAGLTSKALNEKTYVEVYRQYVMGNEPGGYEFTAPFKEYFEENAWSSEIKDCPNL